MEIATREELTSPILTALLDWYEARREGAAWVPLSAFRPETMPAFVLPSLGRVDVYHDPFRVYYRAMGSTFRESIGLELTGRYLDECALPEEAHIADWYRRSLDAPGPLFAVGIQEIDGVRFRYEGGTLPLGTPDDTPRAFIVVEAFPDTEA